MRSWRDAWRGRVAGVALLVVAACGNDVRIADDDTGDDTSDSSDDNDGSDADAMACETSYLDYNNFGAPFVLDWCTGCHSSTLDTEAVRQGAPVEVNLDSLDEIRQRAAAIVVRTTSATPTMPPAGGPSDAERALLAEWLACGAP